MASKLNFRARTLDASKPMAVYNIEDLPELTDLNAINRSVPAMPSGMEKEEESEKHLQDILDAQSSGNVQIDSKNLVIPTPEVFSSQTILQIYKKGYKVPRQYIHVQPFSMDAEKPDYDLDEEDNDFISKVLKDEKKFEIDVTTFEEMIDRLEKNSGHNVITAKEAKLILKEDDDLILAVYDYWVEKRLRIKQPLLPIVKSDKRDIQASQSTPLIPTSSTSGSTGNNIPGTPGTPGLISGGSGSVLGSQATANVTNTNPYIAFRRRTEKMQTRKNRKNDEASYEKMLKLRRDLSRAVVLLEMVKRREKTKKESLNLTAEIFEKRYNAGDYEGKVIAEINALAKPAIPKAVLQPNQYFPNRFTENWIANSGQLQRNFYKSSKNSANKKRKKSGNLTAIYSTTFQSPFHSDDDGFSANGAVSSDYEDEQTQADAPFAFRRKANVQYLAAKSLDCMQDMINAEPNFNLLEAQASQQQRYKYHYASLSNPHPRFLGRIRRRVGRGGRVLLDRIPNAQATSTLMINSEEDCAQENLPAFRPVTPPHVKEDLSWDLSGHFTDALSFPSKPVRLPISSFERHRSISGMGSVKPVSVDSVGAQNAASALVTNNLMDIFGK